jgi:hypothetical protein
VNVGQAITTALQEQKRHDTERLVGDYVHDATVKAMYENLVHAGFEKIYALGAANHFNPRNWF